MESYYLGVLKQDDVI